MKRVVSVAFFVLVLTAAAVGLWIALPPLTTRAVPVPDEFVQWLRSAHRDELAARLSDPLEVSLRLLYFGASDPIDTRGMTIRVHAERDGARVVTIDDRSTEDDSIRRSYSRIRLDRDGQVWIPTEHRKARQGRGVIGWTTGATH